MDACPYPEKKKYKVFSAAFMDAQNLNRHPQNGSPYIGAYECGDHFHVGRLRLLKDHASQVQLNQRARWLQNEIGQGLDFEQAAQLLLELYWQGGWSGRRILMFWQTVPPAHYKPRRKHRRRRDRWNPLNLPPEIQKPMRITFKKPDIASAPEV